MTRFPLLIILSGLLKMHVDGQALGTCDQYSVCIDGICEMQSNQQTGCTCNPGYILDPINPLQCLPVPSCNLLQGSPHEQCLNGACRQQASGAFSCVCYTGFQQGVVNPNICENVDECKLPALGCAPGSCTDLIGDYSCTACIRGHTLDQRGKCQRLSANPLPPQQQQQQQQQQQRDQGQNSALPWLFMDGMPF